MNYNNLHCKIAARILETEPGLLDYRLVERLNKISNLAGGKLRNTEVIASAIVQWQENNVDDFTKLKT